MASVGQIRYDERDLEARDRRRQGRNTLFLTMVGISSALAALLIYLATFVLPGLVAVAAGSVGLVLLGTAWADFCPLYRIFGISTCPAPQK